MDFNAECVRLFPQLDTIEGTSMKLYSLFYAGGMSYWVARPKNGRACRALKEQSAVWPQKSHCL